MDTYTNVILYVVELAYNDQEFQLTTATNKRHLQLRTNESPLWAKENLLNLGVKLLPSDYKAVAFCDADIEFDNPNFAMNTLKILDSVDVVHMHSHCLDLNMAGDPMTVFSSFGYQYTNQRDYSKKDINFWHPGYNIAMTRKMYEKMGGLYQESILGSGDHNLYLSLVGKGASSLHGNTSQGYKDSVLRFEKRCGQVKLGYVPGVIKHYFHGSKKNRKYIERWNILVDNKYDPALHIKTNSDGVQIPTEECPQEMLNQIINYFKERNEDE
jgi:hypothetical protein